MAKSIERLLDFEDKKIPFIFVDGEYFLPIKPICEALGVDYIQQFKNLKSDEILSQLLCEYTTVAADGRERDMLCLPESYIYGWLFSVKSNSPDLKVYKLKCYQVLFHHFHGISKARIINLTNEKRLKKELLDLEDKMAQSEDILKRDELKKEIKNLNKQRKQLDIDLINGQGSFNF